MYKRYVDDVFARGNKYKPDELLHNINFTIERNPFKFLDTKITVNNNGKAHTFSSNQFQSS